MKINLIKNFTENPKDFYVYVHRKASNNQIFYVGKGTKSRAWEVSNRSRKSNNWWKNTAIKHGIIVEIIIDGLQEWAALEIEQGLISLYGRKDLQLGELVNLSDGGESGAGIIVTKETRLKLAITSTGRKHSEEHKRYMSNLLKNRFVSEETRQKISKSKIGVKLTEELCQKLSDASTLKRKVLCVETSQVFESTVQAAKYVDGDSSCITKVCLGKRLKHKGFTWKYYESSDD